MPMIAQFQSNFPVEIDFSENWMAKMEKKTNNKKRSNNSSTYSSRSWRYSDVRTMNKNGKETIQKEMQCEYVVYLDDGMIYGRIQVHPQCTVRRELHVKHYIQII